MNFGRIDKMKKILSAALVCASFLGMIPCTQAAYTDINEASDCYLSALRLQDMGIVNGYQDATFRPDNSITRAEFTKIVVCMMDKEDEAKTSAASSGFYDVLPGSWSAPYINYAVSKDILSGYSDGSFGPDRTISFAEALTILLRTLGYQETDVGYFWPNNYMNAALSLGMTSDMSFEKDTPLTRATAAILTDRALFTKPAGTQGADTYLETLGYTVLADALILDKDDVNDNVSVLGGNLKINNASTYIGRTQMPIEEGDVYRYAVIDKDGYLKTVTSYGNSKELYSETAVVNKVTGNTIEYTTVNGVKDSYKADDGFITYYGNNKMTFASAKANISNGADITFYGNSYGAWNIAVVGNSNDIEPVLATRSYSENDEYFEGKQINKSNLTVYKDGEAATLSDIKAKDVVYYNTKTNTMDVYSKKVTGIYYAASPSKAYVESVTVGGKVYEIGHSSATGKLDASSGAFEIGDKITLNLGKDGKIAFVTDNSSSFDYFEYGVVISSSLKTATEGANEGNTEFVTSMFMADGEVHDIVTDKLYKDNAGDFMRIDYSDSAATLTRQRNTNASNVVGDINFEDRTIGGKYLLKDAAIIQRVSDEDASVAECELLDFESLSAQKIDESHIINAITANKFGDIAILYVENLESSYDYGVVTGFIKNGSETSGYKIFSDGSAGSYTLSGTLKISTSAGAGVGFKTQGNGISKIISLQKLGSATTVGAVEGSRIMLNNKIYKMAADVQIVDITSLTNIRSITVDELDSMNVSSVSLYSDKSLTNGGVVRVVTIKTK